ncbi:MAG: pirin family protein [Cyanobacteriota bacterium]
MHQDVNLYAGLIEPGHTVIQRLSSKRYGRLQMARGNATLNGLASREGNGAAVTEEVKLVFSSEKKQRCYFLIWLRQRAESFRCMKVFVLS